MLKKLLTLCCISMFAIPSAMAGVEVSRSVGSMTAEQVIDKNLAAHGGSQALQKLITMTMSGQMDVGKGMQVPYTLEMKRGRKVRLEIQFGGKTAIQVYDGKNGWKKRPFLGHNDVESFTRDELQKASLDSDIDGPLMDHVSRGTKVTLEGMETIEGHDAYKVKLAMRSGMERHVWIDAKSFLEVKIDGTRKMDGQQKTVETYYRDYRTVEGLTVPFIFETALVGSKTSEKIIVDKLIINPTLDDGLFAQIR